MNEKRSSRLRIRLLIAMAVAATLLLTACGKAAEIITEKAIEAQTGGEVDINLDGNSISFESEEGSASIDFQSEEDGETVVISGTDEEGNEFRVDVGGNEIPADFPMPVFEPSEVTGVITSDVSGGTAYLISLEIAQADVDAATVFYEDWFASEGMEIVAKSTVGSGDDLLVIVTAGSDTAAANVGIVGPGPFQLTLQWAPIG